VNQAKSLYNDVIMDHIKNARNFREPDTHSHRSHGVNPLCGDTFTVYVRIESDRIVDAAFQCECCGISMASASIMTDAVLGKTAQEARALYRHFERLLRHPADPAHTAEAPADAGELAVLELIRDFPSRVNCALLGWKTLDAALEGRAEVEIA
jgi:nitrogen fixation protein NifU and related proteins